MHHDCKIFSSLGFCLVPAKSLCNAWLFLWGEKSDWRSKNAGEHLCPSRNILYCTEFHIALPCPHPSCSLCPQRLDWNIFNRVFRMTVYCTVPITAFERSALFIYLFSVTFPFGKPALWLHFLSWEITLTPKGYWLQSNISEEIRSDKAGFEQILN